jgi:hypothetical protein
MYYLSVSWLLVATAEKDIQYSRTDEQNFEREKFSTETRFTQQKKH